MTGSVCSLKVTSLFLMVSSLSSARPLNSLRWSKRLVITSSLHSNMTTLVHSQTCQAERRNRLYTQALRGTERCTLVVHNVWLCSVRIGVRSTHHAVTCGQSKVDSGPPDSPWDGTGPAYVDTHTLGACCLLVLLPTSSSKMCACSNSLGKPSMRNPWEPSFSSRALLSRVAMVLCV